MFHRQAPKTLEPLYQETYASETRAHEAIQHDLEALMDDFSLIEESIGDIEIADWTN